MNSLLLVLTNEKDREDCIALASPDPCTPRPLHSGSAETKESKYIEVLGKRFLGTVSVGYFSEKITDMEEQFGNRARASAKGVDFYIRVRR